MDIKNCKKCGAVPMLESVDEFGELYQLVCDKCGRTTGAITAPPIPKGNPRYKEMIAERLIPLWEKINKDN